MQRAPSWLWGLQGRICNLFEPSFIEGRISNLMSRRWGKCLCGVPGVCRRSAAGRSESRVFKEHLLSSPLSLHLLCSAFLSSQQISRPMVPWLRGSNRNEPKFLLTKSSPALGSQMQWGPSIRGVAQRGRRHGDFRALQFWKRRGGMSVVTRLTRIH